MRLTPLLMLAAAPLAGQNWQTITQSRQVTAEQRLRVHVEHVAGNLRIQPAAAGQLYRLALRYDEDAFTPSVRYTPSTASLRIDIESRRRDVNIDWDNDHQMLNLAVTNQVPLDLAVRFGAAQASLDLGGLNIRSLDIQTGASESRLAFPTVNAGECTRMELSVGAAEFTGLQLGNARCQRVNVEAGVGDLFLDFTGDLPEGFEGSIDVTMGLGGLELRVPEDIGVRLNVRRFLASVERVGFTRRQDGDWYTPNYDTATRKLRINVAAALGGIEIVRVASAGN